MTLVINGIILFLRERECEGGGEICYGCVCVWGLGVSLDCLPDVGPSVLSVFKLLFIGAETTSVSGHERGWGRKLRQARARSNEITRSRRGAEEGGRVWAEAWVRVTGRTGLLSLSGAAFVFTVSSNVIYSWEGEAGSGRFGLERRCCSTDP